MVMEHHKNWKQFSLYPPDCRNEFQPKQVLYSFLPDFVKSVPLQYWHILFEPSALVRIKMKDEDYPNAINIAQELAKTWGLEFELGDCSRDLNPGLKWKGEDYHGEADFYGDEMWEANIRFMQACSQLALEVSRASFEKQVWYVHKYAHLFTNSMGMNFLEEAAFCDHWKEAALLRYKKDGRA